MTQAPECSATMATPGIRKSRLDRALRERGRRLLASRWENTRSYASTARTTPRPSRSTSSPAGDRGRQDGPFGCGSSPSRRVPQTAEAASRDPKKTNVAPVNTVAPSKEELQKSRNRYADYLQVMLTETADLTLVGAARPPQQSASLHVDATALREMIDVVEDAHPSEPSTLRLPLLPAHPPKHRSLLTHSR